MIKPPFFSKLFSDNTLKWLVLSLFVSLGQQSRLLSEEAYAQSRDLGEMTHTKEKTDEEPNSFGGVCDQEGITPLYFKKSRRQVWRLEGELDSYSQRTIGEVILHCDQKQCEDERSLSEMVRFIQVPRFKEVSAKDLESSWSRMMALGLFEPDSFFILEEPMFAAPQDPLTLRICALSAPIIESIENHYRSWSSALYPKLFFK